MHILAQCWYPRRDDAAHSHVAGPNGSPRFSRPVRSCAGGRNNGHQQWTPPRATCHMHMLQDTTSATCHMHMLQDTTSSNLGHASSPRRCCSLAITAAAHQCRVALQHLQGCHPEIIPEYSELLHMIGPDDPTLLHMQAPANAYFPIQQSEWSPHQSCCKAGPVARRACFISGL